MQRKIGIITPVKHIEGLYELIESKGLVVFHTPDLKLERATDLFRNSKVNTIICNPNKQTFVLNKESLGGSSIKTILTCSTGLSHIDMKYCEENEIEVLSLTTDMDVINQLPSTAELAFILMGNLLRKIPQSTEHVLNGGWDYEPFIGRQIKGLKVGIVGYGRLGKMMYRYCEAFGANIRICDPYKMLNIDTRNCSLEEMFEWADVVSLHVHLNEETKHLIDSELLSLPTKDFYLVNTSRGAVVDEWAISRALDDRKLTGYATDVLKQEGTDNIGQSPIIQAMIDGENVIITPHIGGMTWEGQELAYKAAVNKL